MNVCRSTASMDGFLADSLTSTRSGVHGDLSLNEKSAVANAAAAALSSAVRSMSTTTLLSSEARHPNEDPWLRSLNTYKHDSTSTSLYAMEYSECLDVEGFRERLP